MSRMSNIDLTIQKIKQYITYIIVGFVIIVTAFLVHAQTYIQEKKLKNQIYDLNVQVKSLEETIDSYERGVRE